MRHVKAKHSMVITVPESHFKNQLKILYVNAVDVTSPVDRSSGSLAFGYPRPTFWPDSGSCHGGDGLFISTGFGDGTDLEGQLVSSVRCESRRRLDPLLCAGMGH